jgi:RNA polymerase sigma-70 factor (ECF subfamily)
MNETNWMAERFHENQARLRALAFRMLGSPTEAEDAVQEAWLRLTRADAGRIDNPGGWLTTVVARVCLDMLRSRKSRREESLPAQVAERTVSRSKQIDPEAEVLLADSVGPALLLVLDTLTPTERVAFVLHDLFDLPFVEIASIVGRSETAVRQLASRGRRRVRGGTSAREPDATRQREVVAAFLAASRDGNLTALVELLDPGVRLRADTTAVQAAAANQTGGAPALASEIRGARAVAESFSGRARAAQLALVEGAVGAAWAQGGKPRAVFAFSVEGEKIVDIEVIMDRDCLDSLDVELLGN